MDSTIIGLVALLAWPIVFGGLGRAVGKPRNLAQEGVLIGIFFGPLGIVALLGMDARAMCSVCGTRLNGEPIQCPGCHGEIEWLPAAVAGGTRPVTRHAPLARPILEPRGDLSFGQVARTPREKK